VKIAQVAPLAERVPPTAYGGTERIVSYLTEELVEQGHDVTLFASGDSVTSAKLVPCSPRALRTDPQCSDSLAWHLIELESVARQAEEFDVIHYHVDYLHFPWSKRLRTPHVTTLHGRLDLPELPFIHRCYPGMPLVSISNAQRAPLPDMNWIGTVHHGLPSSMLQMEHGPAEHLTFVGRVSPEKGLDRAIQIAIQADLPLMIAAKVDRADQEYFDTKIAHLLHHPLIHFLGEAGEQEKRELFRKTIALLFPIDWPEPFGLVMIEAMACGVPVIAFPGGSVVEIVEHGRTGFIVNSIDAAVKAVDAVATLDRRDCWNAVATRFSATRMASDYVALFRKLLRTDRRVTEHFQLTGV
jgi:glycosyltransferase involved in cell wall biosynthesis